MKAPLLFMLALAACLPGCIHLPAYNDTVAVNTWALSEQTQAVVANGNAGRLSLADSRRFLRQSREQARGMRARAHECSLSADEVKILDWLDGEYAALLRHPRPLRSASALRLQNSLATLQRLRPVHIYSIPSDNAVATTSDNTIDTNTPDTSKKDCDRKHDHDGHDHGGHDHDRDHDDRDCGCDHGHK